MNAVRPSSCLPCALEDVDDGMAVFRDELWAAEIAPGFEVPGWFFLRVRRHAERLTELNDAELAVLGRRARDLVDAVGTAMGTEVTYLISFGENHPHFHALIIPRDDTVPVHQRGGAIMSLVADRADPPAAREIVPAVRAAYQRTLPTGLAPAGAHLVERGS